MLTQDIPTTSMQNQDCGKKVAKPHPGNAKGLRAIRPKSFRFKMPETGLEPALPLQEPGPQPETADFTSFDQDWKNVGSCFLTSDLRSNSLGLRFAWIWSTGTNTALFLPYRLRNQDELTGT
jgi:hypothetical protein